MRSVSKYLLDAQSSKKIFFIHSQRKSSQLSFISELELWQKKHANFDLYLTLTQEHEDRAWGGFRGRINADSLKNFLDNLENKHYYICGSESFSKAITDILLNNNISKASITKISFGSQPKKSSMRYFTQDEVAKHNSLKSAWVSFENKVFDLTAYIHEHPGGDILLSYAGKDMTGDFHKFGHSGAAMKKLNTYRIGFIKK